MLRPHRIAARDGTARLLPGALSRAYLYRWKRALKWSLFPRQDSFAFHLALCQQAAQRRVQTHYLCIQDHTEWTAGLEAATTGWLLTRKRAISDIVEHVLAGDLFGGGGSRAALSLQDMECAASVRWLRGPCNALLGERSWRCKWCSMPVSPCKMARAHLSRALNGPMNAFHHKHKPCSGTFT